MHHLGGNQYFLILTKRHCNKMIKYLGRKYIKISPQTKKLVAEYYLQLTDLGTN